MHHMYCITGFTSNLAPIPLVGWPQALRPTGVGIWALRAMKGNSDGAGNFDVAGTSEQEYLTDKKTQPPRTLE